jgi:hypothetical protein
LNSLVLFLLRTALYTSAVRRGTPVFSVSTIAEQLKMPELVELFRMKYAKGPQWENFLRARKFTERYLRTKCRNPFGSLEALITNYSQKCPLIVAFGLRALSGQSLEFTYDLLGWPESMH